MEQLSIYVILIISIFILYIAIKSKNLVCEPEELKVNVEVKDIKVSDIFKSMFDLAEPRPGNAGLI